MLYFYRLDSVLAKLIMGICILLMSVIFIVVIASVFTRFFIFYPLHFAGGLSKYLMMWMVCLGIGLAIREGEHIMVDMLVRNLSHTKKILVKYFETICLASLFLMIIYFGFINSVNGINSRDPFVFNVSMMIPYLSVPTGAAYALFQVIISHLKYFEKMK